MVVSKRLLKDKSRKKEPFFLREEGEIVYTGFPLISETETEGFIYGAITDFLEPDTEEGCIAGDGYIQAPDGSRAGLVWQVSDKIEVKILEKPNLSRWGVYSVNFPKPIKTKDDLVFNFREVLPLLIEKYKHIKK
jgi:hypothetical protein